MAVGIGCRSKAQWISRQHRDPCCAFSTQSLTFSCPDACAAHVLDSSIASARSLKPMCE